ncbi:MAG: hypothetical protein PHY59_09120, partial [Methanobacterium sp.]|nr:hypothetical protein [Methanobacterium sp.]
MKDKFWIFFIVFLVLSITPASASGLGVLSKGMKEENSLLDQDGKNVIKHADNVKGYGEGILRCVVNIFHCIRFIAANIWKWWNWDEVWDNICKAAKNVYKINNYIDSTANEGSGTLMSILYLVIDAITSVGTVKSANNKLSNKDELKLSSEKLVPLNNLYVNNETNLDNQTNNITKPNNIKASHGSNLNIQNISVDNLQTGDVVIYNSKGLYYRYLQFISIKDQTTEALNQNISTQIVVLNGPYNKIKEIPYNDFIKDYTGQA